MGTLNRNFRTGLMSSIAMTISNLFGLAKHKQEKHHNPSKNSRGYYNTGNSVQNPAGSKIRRAIARGNFGVVNKHGMIGRAVAEQKRENWLLDHGKPVIRLSTSV